MDSTTYVGEAGRRASEHPHRMIQTQPFMIKYVMKTSVYGEVTVVYRGLQYSCWDGADLQQFRKNEILAMWTQKMGRSDNAGKNDRDVDLLPTMNLYSRFWEK